MPTVQELLQSRLSDVRLQQSQLISDLNDPDFRPLQRRHLRDSLKVARQVESEIVSQLSKFAYLK